MVVLPMTTTLRNYATRVEATHREKKGMIAIDQIKTIDKYRKIKRYKSLSKLKIKKAIIKETFVD